MFVNLYGGLLCFILYCVYQTTQLCSLNQILIEEAFFATAA